jgi:hypothetical protein
MAMGKKGTREMTTFTTQDRQDAQRTPLTNENIKEIMDECCYTEYTLNDEEGFNAFDYHEFARAIERAHGIGE